MVVEVHGFTVRSTESMDEEDEGVEMTPDEALQLIQGKTQCGRTFS